ncbi:HEPN domain-containing protein [Calidithermus roseus]|uniref:HEPN domain-containing protein n=1 Tax=Calidithermus roseus TaxID=1644118 RepID=UPI00308456A0
MRAKGNLVRAEAGRFSPEVLYEDLCFDAQQAVEKALKALLVARKQPFPKTHDISLLLQLLAISGLAIPSFIQAADTLTLYAVATRYPGDYPEVAEADYLEALQLAQRVVAWVEAQL